MSKEFYELVGKGLIGLIALSTATIILLAILLT